MAEFGTNVQAPHYLINNMSEGNTLSDVPTFCEVQLMSEQKVKKPSKKVLIREIAELSDLFNLASLERTNVENLIQIKVLLDSK